ncbi:hypothetical protein ACMGDK_16605 [Chryseobacterium sp. DT-3]|uniref:hypothetical protein n=1 Tax=Chryseobacterium sp. DT-3 TaxID=3396164 RepID=UPI003F1D12BE
MKLKFKIISSAPILILLGLVSFLLPYLLLTETTLVFKERYLWLFYFELIALFTIFFLWYKIYNEIVFAEIKDGVLYYKKLFFISKSIKIEDIKGYKTGNEEADFFVLYNKNNEKLFVVRMDLYSNYYDFIDALRVEKIGNYYTIFQKILFKIFRTK